MDSWWISTISCLMHCIVNSLFWRSSQAQEQQCTTAHVASYSFTITSSPWIKVFTCTNICLAGLFDNIVRLYSKNVSSGCVILHRQCSCVRNIWRCDEAIYPGIVSLQSWLPYFLLPSYAGIVLLPDRHRRHRITALYTPNDIRVSSTWAEVPYPVNLLSTYYKLNLLE